MATTNSFPSAVSTNSISANNWFADDGQQNSPIYQASVGDLTLSSFSSLSIPGGSTINGIRIDVEGAGNPGTDNIPHMKVYNGSGWSSAQALEGEGSRFTKAGATFSPGWGGDDDLWGLVWNSTTAAAIQIQIQTSTFDSGGYFWDWLRVYITYTEGSKEKKDRIKFKAGKININAGRFTLK